MIRFDEASDVRQIINLIVNSMSPSQKTNPQSYALRLRHMLTKEVSNQEFYTLSRNSLICFLFSLDFMDATRYINDSGNGTHI